METTRIVSVSLFLLLGLGSSPISGNPAKPVNAYQTTAILTELTDPDLKKFYTDFYDEEYEQAQTDDRMSTIDDYADYHGDGKAHQPIASIEDSILTNEHEVENVVDTRDPTFVLSRLLFHLSQLSEQ